MSPKEINVKVLPLQVVFNVITSGIFTIINAITSQQKIKRKCFLCSESNEFLNGISLIQKT